MEQRKRTEQDALERRFYLIKRKVRHFEILSEDVKNLSSIKTLKATPPLLPWRKIFAVVALAIATFGCFCYSCFYFHWPVSRKIMFQYGSSITAQNMSISDCFVRINTYMLSSVRPSVACDMCRNFTSIDRVPATIRPEEVLEKYVKHSRPVLIEGAFNISATGIVFDFEYFRKLYGNSSASAKNDHPLCEFERYLTKATTVQELLDMKAEEVNSPGGEDPSSWYVGWANCDRYVTEELNKYFKPTFLPQDTDFSRTFWIYMGSPGHGFEMHIDPRFQPQWQTQVHGRKLYRFQAPPECYFECPYDEVEVIMNPGDTLVFHAGKWYHETENVGDSIIVALGTAFVGDENFEEGRY